MSNRTDDFNRANTASNIGNPSDGGSAWVQLNGTWGISGNAAYESAGISDAVCYLESSVSDGDLSVTVGQIGSGNGWAMAFRISDASNYWYVTAFGGFALIISKRVAGSDSDIHTTSQTVNTSDVLKVTMSGNSLTVFVNGSQISALDTTDSFNNTATKVGLCRVTGFGTNLYDDFSFVSASPPPPGVAYVPETIHSFARSRAANY